MRLYVCGPIRKAKNYNYYLFYHTTMLLRQLGHTVRCPLEADFIDGTGTVLDPGERANFGTYEMLTAAEAGPQHDGRVYMASCFDHESHKRIIGRDLRFVLDAEALVLLPSYGKSEGAAKEIKLADMALIPTYELHALAVATYMHPKPDGAVQKKLEDLWHDDKYGEY